jgi:hypothetical protein
VPPNAQRGIELDPTEVVGHATLSIVLSVMGRHDEAITEADLAVSAYKTLVAGWGQIGRRTRRSASWPMPSNGLVQNFDRGFWK